MYVKVIYFKEWTGGYTGREYTYKAPEELGLQMGDDVLVPVATDKELKRAMVTEINVPESEISPEWVDKIKTITRRYIPEPEAVV